MRLQRKPALLTLCGVSLALLAGLLFTIYQFAPRPVLAQEEAEPGIAAPIPGSYISGTVSIVGTATDPAFQRYELYAKLTDAGEDTYVFIDGDDEAVIDGPLGVWDTGELEPGAYDLRLRVVRIDGNYDEYFATGLLVGLVPETPTAIAPTPAATTPVTTVATLLPTDTVTAPVSTEVPPTDTATISPTATATAVPTETPTEVSTEVPTEAPTEEPAEPQMVAINNINVRSGPGTEYDVVDALDAGESAPITGQNEAGDWWQIEVDTGNGWVLARLVTAENATDVPVVDAPPAPEPLPTPVPALTTTVEATDTTTVAEPATPVGPVIPAASSFMAAPVAPGGVVTVTLTGNDADPDALSALLRSVLVGFSIGDSVITATVGTLPEGLPITITVPSTTTVVGSVVRTGDFESSQLFLSTETDAETLIDLVRQQLLDAGFTTLSQDAMGGGSGQVFLSSDSITASRLLCSPDDAWSVTLGAVNIAGDTAVVSVHVSPVSRLGGPCGQEPVQAVTDLYSVLPSLLPPLGAQVRDGGGGSGGGPDGYSVSAEAEIESELSVAELAAHYEEQLRAAGWERLDDSQSYALAWSAWSFVDDADEAWNATFYIVLQSGEENSYVATLRAETQP